MIEQLKEQIQAVRGLREVAAKAKATRQESYTHWQLEHSTLFHDEQAALETVKIAEEILRKLTIQAYQETGNKAPAPGVGIREGEELIFNEAEALEWSLDNCKPAVKLDIIAFKKAAKIFKPGFVTFKPVVTATIATELPKE